MFKINDLESNKIAENFTSIIFSNPNITAEENLNRFINITSQVPHFYIKNEELRGNFEDPYSITDPLNGNNLAIFDRKYQKHYIEDENANLVLTKDKIIIQHGDNNPDILRFSEFAGGHFTNESDLNFIINIISQAPDLTIKNGKIFTKNNADHEIKALKDYTIIRIDTNITDIAEIDIKYAETPIIITQDQVFFQDPFKNETVQIYIKDIDENMVFNAAISVIDQSKNILMIVAPFILIPTILLSAFVLTAFMALLYGVISVFIAQILLKRKIAFQPAVRISSIAITPVTLLNVILPSTFSSQGAIYFVITAIYIYIALKSLPQINEENSNE